MSDARPGPYPRLTAAAVERAKTRLGISKLERLGDALGFSYAGFHRVRQGQLNIRYSHALRVARQIGWPLSKTFELPGGPDA